MNPLASTFNPDLFLQTNYSEETSTKTNLLPVGDYTGVIKELTPRNVQGKQDTTKWYVFLDFQVEIGTPPELKEEIGRDFTRIRHSIGIDLSENGAIDMGKGKNIQLGRLREATGQNVSGQPWTPASLNNAMVKVKVSQEPNPKDPEIKYNRIDAFGKVE